MQRHLARRAALRRERELAAAGVAGKPAATVTAEAPAPAPASTAPAVPASTKQRGRG